jgi:cell division protein FtsL
MSDGTKGDKNWGQMYADRAQQPAVPGTLPIPRVREARDMVYGGTMPAPDGSPESGPAPEARNRRTSKRKYSPFNVIIVLLALAVVSVLYIGNVLAVGRLLGQINELEQAHQRMYNDQQQLRAQINRLSGLERMEKLAQEQLGLRTPAQAPVWLPANDARVQELDEALRERRGQ